MTKQNKVPIPIKCVFALFLMVMVPIYWVKYGPTNFLWFSDVTLFLAFFAVLFESRLVASMAVLGGFVLESFWNVNYFLQLLAGYRLSPLTDYMFQSQTPIWLRGISLFHVALPPLVVWLVWRLGYDKRAWLLQTVLAIGVIITTWMVSEPAKNINWVYSYQKITMVKLDALSFLVLEGSIVVLVIAATHAFFSLALRKRTRMSQA